MKKPFINDRGLVAIKATKNEYRMLKGKVYERPAHIADKLVKLGVAKYVKFVEV